MKTSVFIVALSLLVIVGSFPHNAIAQLLFEPNIANGEIAFDDTPVGETARAWVTMIGNQNEDALEDVVIQIDNNVFAANPANFRIEPGQRVAVTFSFTPRQAADYEGVTTIAVSIGQGRQIIYRCSLSGTGIEDPAPEIEVSPAEINLRIEEDGAEDEAVLTIRNVGDADLTWNIPAFNAGWLTIAPRNGRIAEGNSSQITFSTNNIPNENGDYRVTISILSDDPDHDEIQVPVTLTVAIPDLEIQTIHLSRGWNVISLNVLPRDGVIEGNNVDIGELINDILDRVIMVKDCSGRFCLPGRQYWGIPYWDVTQGYWIKTSEAIDWEILGEPIPEDASIHLEMGWNAIAYYPRRQDDPINLFSELEDAGILRFVKGPRGQFYAPGFGHYEWFLRPNDAVMIKLSEAVDFRYPVE